MRRDVFPEVETGPFVMDALNARNVPPPAYLVFTDLDGTLLDHHTYDWKAALPALDVCRNNHVPVILVSSKTRAEMDVLRRKLHLSAPFVSENGGGVFFPMETVKTPPAGAVAAKTVAGAAFDGLWQWSLGTPYGQLIRALREIRDRLGWAIRGFFEMDVNEIARLTGLDEETARLAALREYDEPFIIDETEHGDLEPLHQAAAALGLTVVSGGRFHHLMGDNHKGKAMTRLVSWYHGQYFFNGKAKSIPTIALGDSPNDFSMLSRADFPILIRSERDFEELKRDLPNLGITQDKGPKGWNTAILNILKNSKEKADA